MGDVLLNFEGALQTVRTASSTGLLWASVKQFVSTCGYTHVVAVDAARLAGGAQEAALYTDAPDVVAAIDRSFPYKSAPFVQRALNSPEPFLMSQLRDDPKTAGSWFDLLAEVVRKGEALVIPVYDAEGPVGGCLFAGLQPDLSALTQAALQVLAHAAVNRHFVLRSKSGQPSMLGLTTREIQCLRAAASGASDAEVGEQLGISARTVRFHIDGAKTKLNANSRIQAISRALQERIISI